MTTILGIWDGHDCGAALLRDGVLVAAVNEERLTRRKLEIGFPQRSISCCLELAGLEPADVEVVAFSTCDPAKALTRLRPGLGESYYELRRRKVPPGLLTQWKKRSKYWLTELSPNMVSRWLSRRVVAKRLANCGLGDALLELHDHHAAHAHAAAFGSDLGDCIVLTLDGVGDGLSTTVSELRDGQLRRLAASRARDSIGILFEHTTNLLHMRELEDEGKVMALADYAAPVSDQENAVFDLIEVDGLVVRTRVPGHSSYRTLQQILACHPPEQFANMMQRATERAVVQLARNACDVTGLSRIALAGGVASNVKANRRVRGLECVERLFVYPHMGDGGLAAGAAFASAMARDESVEPLGRLSLGPAFSDGQVETAIAEAGASASRPRSIEQAVAEKLTRDQVVLWFQGGMEYGPRALGWRSVLARPDRATLRDRLNLVLKKRVWYQPFCPTIRADEAAELLADFDGTPNRYMTETYLVRESERARMAGVISVDGTCRPQILPSDEPHPLLGLLEAMKTSIGTAALLNTSFNIHGEPLVCTPAQALDVLVRSGADALAIGPYLVENAAGAGGPEDSSS